ncbi:MAG: PEP-CTERM sorting domain-containing protein [Oscillatoria sp. SIO1A7]|nr:PEP-CTERM sorting domain-containing protein [Oscillatoria sp. SIO1A7]
MRPVQDLCKITLGVAVITLGTLTYHSSAYAGSLGPKAIDLREWTQQGILEKGNWVVSDDGTSVVQDIHEGSGTFFVSPDKFINTIIRGKFKVDTKQDDDWMGLMFGLESPTGDNIEATGESSFFLFDWKQADQGSHKEGLSLAKVSGKYGAYANRSRFDVLRSDFGQDKGWQDLTEYEFALLYEEEGIKIDIDGQTIFEIDAEELGRNFDPGHVALYTASQKDVKFSDLSYESTAASTSVPEPSSAIGLLGIGAAGVGSLLKGKKRSQ